MKFRVILNLVSEFGTEVNNSRDLSAITRALSEWLNDSFTGSDFGADLNHCVIKLIAGNSFLVPPEPMKVVEGRSGPDSPLVPTIRLDAVIQDASRRAIAEAVAHQLSSRLEDKPQKFDFLRFRSELLASLSAFAQGKS
jgi:hypothetical protein